MYPNPDLYIHACAYTTQSCEYKYICICKNVCICIHTNPDPPNINWR